MHDEGRYSRGALLVILFCFRGCHVNSKRALYFLAWTTVAACAPAAAPAPPRVRIEIVDVGVGLGKADRTQWDGVLRVPSDLASSPGFSVDAIPSVFIPAVAAALAAHTALEKPDVKGLAELDRTGAGFSEAQTLPLAEDSFTPTFRPSATFRRVALTDRTLVRVALIDDDVANDDPIGTVTLNAADLREALRQEGHVHHVAVGRQSFGQVMFVGIVVVADD